MMICDRPFKAFCLTLGAVALMSCGSAATSSGDGTSDSGGSAATTSTDDSVSSAMPADVVLSSPTASSSASSNLAVGKAVRKAAGDATGEDFAAKKEALQALLDGEGECSFTFSFPDTSPPDCYGPDLVYANHPEASIKDSDVTNGDSGFTDTDGDGGLPTGDLGFWNATEGTEACAAAKMNQLIAKAASKVDNMVSLFGVMACAGKKAGLDLPAVGASINLAEALAANATVTGLTVSAATLARLSDDSAGNAVYRSSLEVSIVANVGGQEATQTGELTLTHVVTAADESTYRGKLSFALHNSTFLVGGCSQAQTGSTSAGVISYEKVSATVLRQEFQGAEFCGASADVFDANYDISPADKVTEANLDGWSGDWKTGLFEINPVDGTGSVAYAWQAGSNDGASRVLNVSVAAAADGSASGTAYFGYGPDVVLNTDVGTIDGFYCNWAGPNNRSTRSSLAQRQVLARAAGAADFTASSSNIAYAPTNSCDSSGTDGSGNNFGFGSSSFTSAVMDNDAAMGTAVTNDLIDLADVSFTLPTAPASL